MGGWFWGWDSILVPRLRCVDGLNNDVGDTFFRLCLGEIHVGLSLFG